MRIEPTARSTLEASSPTFSCCSCVALRIRPLSSDTPTTETPSTTTIDASSTGSMNAIATIAPTNSRPLPTASASPCVRTA